MVGRARTVSQNTSLDLKRQLNLDMRMPDLSYIKSEVSVGTSKV